MTFPNDPLVSETHSAIEEQAGSIVLTDLGSRAGTFVRITGQREILDGDEIAIGRTRLRASIP
jgi:pSer/pThr/pTyr-binding forkhead associated (FHA) protein